MRVVVSIPYLIETNIDVSALTLPADGSTLDDYTPAFAWSALRGVDDYTLQISNDAAFTDLYATITQSGVTYVPGSDMPTDTFYWRVRGNKDDLPGPWSIVYSFTIPELGIPLLVLPADAEVLTTYNANFEWQAVFPSVTYDIQIAEDSDFELIIDSASSLTDTTYVSSGQFDRPLLIFPANEAVQDTYIPVFDWSVAPLAEDYEIEIAADSEFTEIAETSTGLLVTGFTPVTFAPPELNSPTNGSLVEDLTPTFAWESLVGVDEYTIDIASDSDFETIIDTQDVAENSYTPITPINPGVYYWRVRVGYRARSPFFAVTLVVPMTLLTPAALAPLDDFTPAFEWEAGVDVDTYDLQVATDSDFNTLVLSESVIGTTFTPGSELERTIHYWRVRAVHPTITSPWSETRAFYFPLTFNATPSTLQDVLDDPDIQPGDIVLLEAGTYAGYYDISVQGVAGYPVVIQGAASWTSIIDGGLHLLSSGQYARVIGLRVSFSGWTTRTTTTPGSDPGDLPQSPASDGAINIHMPGAEVIDCWVDNNRAAFGWWIESTDSLLYGNLMIHNGWRGPDRLHGPGCYFQNDTGEKLLDSNIFAGNYWQGIYMVSTDAPEKHITSLRNFSIQNPARIASKQPAEDIVYSYNWFGANSPLTIGGYVQHHSITFDDNEVLLNPIWYRAIWIFDWLTFNMRRNRISGNETSYPIDADVPLVGDIDENEYWYTERVALPGAPFLYDGVEIDFAGWQALGFDLNGTFHEEQRAGSYTIVPVLSYGLRRWNLAIDNPEESLTVDVDFSGQGLIEGENYRLINVINTAETQDFEYTGAIVAVAMDLTEAIPLGDTANVNSLCFPESGVFVVIEL